MQISEVSEKYDISADTLRYYERIGLLPPVGRTASGLRDYGESDLGWIEFIKCMRSAGLSIEQLVKYVRLFGQGDETHDERKQILMAQREEIAARVAELQQTLAFLDYKIAFYDSRLAPVERELARKDNRHEP